MIDNMRGRCVATGAAEPFVARKTFHDTARVVNTTIPETISLVSMTMTICFLPSILERKSLGLLTRRHEPGAPSLPPHIPRLSDFR